MFPAAGSREPAAGTAHPQVAEECAETRAERKAGRHCWMQACHRRAVGTSPSWNETPPARRAHALLARAILGLGMARALHKLPTERPVDRIRLLVRAIEADDEAMVERVLA